MSTITTPSKSSHLRAIETARRLGFHEPEGRESFERTNPFSGVTCRLTGLGCMMYDFITTKVHTCGRDYSRRDWDWARYMFLELWPDEYYKLID